MYPSSSNSSSSSSFSLSSSSMPAGSTTSTTSISSTISPDPQLAGRVTKPPSPHVLNKAGAMERGNLESRVAKGLALVMVGLGVAAMFTGFGIPAGAVLIACGGLLFGGSVEADMRWSIASANGKNGSLNVVTYDLGGGFTDFRQLCSYLNVDKSWITDPMYQDARGATAALIIDLVQTGKADILTLQNITSGDGLIKKLTDQGLSVIHIGSPDDDCAIVLDPKRFCELERFCAADSGLETVLVVARDNRSKQTFLFGSAHIPWMDLTQNNFASRANKYIEDLVTEMNKLSARYPGIIRVLGADMNGNPEKWRAPFDALKAEGFHLHRTGAITAVGSPQRDGSEREVDFIFTGFKDYPTWLDWLFGTMKKVPIIEAQTTTLMDIRERAEMSDSASNHVPVNAKIEYIYNQPATPAAT